MASRVNFKTIIDKYRTQGKGNVRLTQSTLYLSKAISTSSTTYNFDVLETQNSTLQNNEIRLNLNDEFIITSLGVFIEASIKDPMGGGTYGTKLFSYAPYQLNSAFAGLTPFYNGSLQVSVNNIVYLDKFDTGRSNFVPRTQDNPASAVTSIVNSTLGSNNYAENGLVDLEPMLTLSGAKKNTITLTLPQALTKPSATISTNNGQVTITAERVVVLARGLNAQNGASFQQ